MLQKQLHACQRNGIFIYAERKECGIGELDVLVLCPYPLKTKINYVICIPLCSLKEVKRVLEHPEKWYCTIERLANLKPISLVSEGKAAQMKLTKAGFFSPEVTLINL